MATTFDLDAMKAARQRRDVDALTDMYADDAVITVIDASHPPSRPMRIEGRDAIHALLDDICSRDMTHEVSDAALGADFVSWTTKCQYSTGQRVLSNDIAHLRDGRIVSDTMVQAWDE